MVVFTVQAVQVVDLAGPLQVFAHNQSDGGDVGGGDVGGDTCTMVGAAVIDSTVTVTPPFASATLSALGADMMPEERVEDAVVAAAASATATSTVIDTDAEVTVTVTALTLTPASAAKTDLIAAILVSS